MEVVGIIVQNTRWQINNELKLGILEDDVDMRDYLLSIFKDNTKFKVMFSCATIKEARQELTAASDLDICLVDLQLPDGNGGDFVKHMIGTTQAKALILTVLGDRTSVLAALEAGAHGYLLKDTAPEQILAHIEDTMGGANPISPQAATHLLDLFKSQNAGPEQEQPASTLTDRETDILTMFAKGLSYRETAEALHISPHTVSDYVKTIYGKLSVHSRNEAVFEALQMGWIEI